MKNEASRLCIGITDTDKVNRNVPCGKRKSHGQTQDVQFIYGYLVVVLDEVITRRKVTEEMRMVLKRPKKESATKAPSTGKSVETPTHVLTFLTAVAVG